jgi:hypothetical protein
MTDQATKQWKGRAIIIGVFLLFFLPILFSWYLVFFTDYKHDSNSGTQHGILVDPPRQLDNLTLNDPLSGIDTSLYGKWTMFTIVEGGCNQPCMEILYRMRQIRLATGKEMHRVQRASYFADMNTLQEAKTFFTDFPGQLLIPKHIDEKFLSSFTVEGRSYEHAIFLIDPAGFLMMVYPESTDPSGIIKDLKKLLRISKTD